jgi:hypothetical protein
MHAAATMLVDSSIYTAAAVALSGLHQNQLIIIIEGSYK